MLYAYSRPVGAGTGFIVRYLGQDFLITNYHVLSGLHPDSGKLLPGVEVCPDRVLIPLLNSSGSLSWTPLVQELVGPKTWVEHPRFGSQFDVVALPLDVDPSRFAILTYDFNPGPDLLVIPSSDVSIVGFPQGVTGPGLSAIWKGGVVASEVDWPDQDERLENQFFHVDSNTRSGMSGSPVIVRRSGQAHMASGSTAMFPGVWDLLLGVYAGRALDAPDMTLGRVWKWRGVQEILESAVRQKWSGALKATVGLLGYYLSSMNEIRLEWNKSVEFIAVNPQTGVGETKNFTVFEFLKTFAVNDQRFGINLERVKMSARVVAACEHARETDSPISLRPEDYAVVREAIETPSQPYNPVAARQLLPLIQYILDAPPA